MTTITITIPDNITNRVINGFCKRYSYSPYLEGGAPNPETKAQFAKRKIIEFIKQAVKDTEVTDATNEAATTAATAADAEITLT